MEDASKYNQRPKLDGDKTELFRIYYSKNQISFELFLWIEKTALEIAAKRKYKIFKAYYFPGFETPSMICKN